jgi:excisionase family DNA binding protein
VLHATRRKKQKELFMDFGNFLTVKEVAELCRVHIKFIRNEITRGNLPAVKVGRAFLVDRKDMAAYLEARKVVADGAAAING